jgi:cysteine-rich repeat protein
MEVRGGLFMKQSLQSNVSLLITLFVFITALCPVPGAEAAVHFADTCEQAEVQAAIDLANYGDTVVVPSGSCTWTGGIEFSKDIKIIGAGIDLTTLTLDFTDNFVKEAFFEFTPDATSRDDLDSLSDTNTFEVSGINFVGNGRMSYKWGVYIPNYNTPAIKRVNIHNNKFTDIHRAVQTNGYIHGVFHHNILINTNGNYPQGNGYISFVNDRMTLGSGSGWYIEDNNFSFSGDALVCGAGNAGGGFVVRYNTVTGTLSGGSTYIETHGNQLTYIYGPQITEVYGNNMTATAGRVTNVRGGKNIYLNNIFVASSMQIWEEYSDNATSPTNPPGRCPENQEVERQTCTDACICQKVHDSYFINNRASVTGTIRIAGISTYNPCGVGVLDCENLNEGIGNVPLELAENIEFFNHVPSGFDGTAGVGCGTPAEMNAITTCNEGVGFWATEQSCTDLTGMIGADPIEPINGTLYKCGISDEWEVFYTPYTYPHPLTVPVCGNYITEMGEECDDGNTEAGDGCSNDCMTEPICGNSLTEPGEACDGSDLNGYTCATIAAGFVSGTLACKPDCSSYDASHCVPGNTIQAANCSQTEVQSAIDSASDGDTVVVPNGNCVWSGVVEDNSHTKYGLLIDKGIFLKGGGIDNTVIGLNNPSGTKEGLFLVTTDKPFRISGITMTSSTDSSRQAYGIEIAGSPKNWRIDHLKISGFTYGTSTISVNRYTSGVIDHVQFTNIVAVGVDISGYTPGDGDSAGTQSWASPLSLGTANAVYVEDSSFIRSNSSIASFGESVASNRGSRYVVRYSNLQDTNPNAYSGPLDAHGYCTQNDRGSRSWEVYNNNISWAGNGHGMVIRGGDGVAFNNVFSAPNGEAFRLFEERADVIMCEYCGNPSDPDCGSKINYPEDYPLKDQINAYFWNNTISPNLASVYVYNNDYERLFIQENRDYYNNIQKPDYTPYVYPHPLTLIDASIPGLHPSDINQNGCVELAEMISFMERWKISVADVNMPEMMESIGLWKSGTGC